MKKYEKPVVEKICFDYTIQTATSGCYQALSVIRTGESECVGTPSYMWVLPDDGSDW